jgi:hypothetical protein
VLPVLTCSPDGDRNLARQAQERDPNFRRANHGRAPSITRFAVSTSPKNRAGRLNQTVPTVFTLAPVRRNPALPMVRGVSFSTKPISGWDNQPPGFETSFNLRTAVDGQRAFSDEFAQEFSLDDRVSHQHFRVEDVALLFHDKEAFGPKILRDRAGDVIVPQIHVVAAPLAHCGFRGDRDLEFGPAIETSDFPSFDFRRTRSRRGLTRGGRLEIIQAKVFVTLLQMVE